MIFISASDIWASDFCKSLWILKVRKLSDAIPEAEIPHRPVWKKHPQRPSLGTDCAVHSQFTRGCVQMTSLIRTDK